MSLKSGLQNYTHTHTPRMIVEELGHTYCDVSDPGECVEDLILIHFLPLQMF